MDYGRNSQFAGNNNQPFFTAGAGSISPNANYFESENNLDLTNQVSWDQAQDYRNRRDYRGIGNRAIMPSEAVGGQLGFSERTTGFNSSIPIESESPSIDPLMPPDISVPDMALPRRAAAKSTYQHHLIRAEGDHISKSTVEEVNQAITKLSQTDNAADFYATIRGSKDAPGMLQDYLKNSYNREVA